MLNKFIGIGRWSSEIKLNYTPNGKAVANANIAINDRYGDDESTTFLPVVMWGKTAENTAQYSNKGKLVAVVGRIQVRSWESDNGKRYVTEVVADNVQFLESNRSQQQDNSGSTDPFTDCSKPIDISDGDLPF
ncbi:single-stranded DNA-binding protein [Paenibacillus sp. UMB4589-SE434]|uniref:single-stranded DNA-binding protein n=1 Tax=Paenibacillus sp. UMB4589-SE434 TaxID=3046314 RepID=UPI00254B0C2F|nr:single-stranded DNA-binding protein [Paenibacillus sp. UMB4589-SE434]MDK8182077.1 single-stranded DNA-binding protein [Paenibacillus sp. UMB4589-SE434]